MASELKLVPYLKTEQIQKRVQEMAEEIKRHYGNKPFTAIAVLKGSFMFYSDLIRALDSCDLTCDFLSVSSYSGLSSSGEVKVHLDLSSPITGKHVLLIEDIVDTGLTLNFLRQWLEQRQPASLKTAALLLKPDALKVTCQLDFIGFKIPNDFVVGYGLDYEGHYRNLPYIAQVQMN